MRSRLCPEPGSLFAGIFSFPGISSEMLPAVFERLLSAFPGRAYAHDLGLLARCSEDLYGGSGAVTGWFMHADCQQAGIHNMQIYNKNIPIFCGNQVFTAFPVQL